jgi:hypothetical protein
MPEKKEQGTGRHPHKSSEQPWPHHESGGENQGGSQPQRSGSEGEKNSGSSDTQEREYRDKQGKEHHHTHTYEEQHRKSG